MIERRDFSTRVRKTTGDEIGVLVDSFNSMLAELGERARALQASNEALQHETGERRDAEEALRVLNNTLEERIATRTEELEHAHEQLRQSQKMEAIGQLTGGIAHDFNNMLQAIGGSLQLMRRKIERGRANEALDHVDSARKTVDRAAALTNRLLAFARRQALQPRPVDVDALIVGMEELIRGTVGPTIAVDLRMGDGIWPVVCDPNQLENALLNIAINARDAMPDGGRLAIRTSDRPMNGPDGVRDDEGRSGDYVEIAVVDTGTGMDPATIARVFEPFFTTKPIGRGTGLGLSQVYGFVRQSGGFVQLDSVPGAGTTVRLYLPRHHVTDQAEVRPPQDVVVPGREKGVLVLVEDESEVRAMTTEWLRDLGYEVLEAEDGPAALRLFDRSAPVDLLVTDVGLPNGLNGRQVADAARERWPGLPVLFITGYAGSALQAELAPDMQLLGKPFSLDILANRIAGMLHERGNPRHDRAA